MKVFEFDPTTGRRGEFIENRKRAGWGDCCLTYAIKKGLVEPVEFVTPTWNNCDITVHVDGGVEIWTGADCEFKSYRHPTKWVCFCTGQYQSGLDKGVWDWWILPPVGLVIQK